MMKMEKRRYWGRRWRRRLRKKKIKKNILDIPDHLTHTTETKWTWYSVFIFQPCWCFIYVNSEDVVPQQCFNKLLQDTLDIFIFYFVFSSLLPLTSSTSFCNHCHSCPLLHFLLFCHYLHLLSNHFLFVFFFVFCLLINILLLVIEEMTYSHSRHKFKIQECSKP